MTRTCSSVFTLGLALMLLSTLAAAQPKSNRAQAAVDTSVVFSEIMYDPPSNGTNDEYLEVFNTSTTTSINLSGWKIGGSVTNPVTLSDTGTGQTTLAPQSYAVILGSGYFSGGARAYQNAIPAGTLVMKTSAGLSLNNGSDNLRLITASGDTVASLTYTGPSDAQGKSLEKILLNRNDAATNYALSITGGTPGTKNSVAPPGRDAAHIRLMFTPSDSVSVGTSALLTSTVKNLGLLALTNFTVDFYEDANANTQLEAAEKFDTKSFSGSLAQNDSASVTANILTPAAGTRQFGAVIVSAGDEFSGNDTLRAALKVYVPITNNPLDTNLIVSEIMYAPTSPQPEFIELFNKSTNAADSIKLNGLRIGDRATLSQVIKDSGVNLFLKPQQYAVVFANGNLATGTANYVIPASALTLEAGADLSLNNSGDSVVVINAAGTTLSRFFYADNAAPAGKSSEKIAPTRTDSASNFAASVAASGSTPGARNSVTLFDRNLSVQTNAAFFTPPATPVNLTYNVINRGLQPFGNSATIRLFKDDDKNNLPDASEQINLFTLTTNLNPKDTLKSSFAFTPASQDSVNFIFTLTVAGDEDTTNNLARTTLLISDTSIVLNEIMFDPPGDANSTSDEFIELYNTSDTKSIDLRNWKIADASSAVALTDSSNTGTGNTVLPPKSFAIIFGGGYFTGATRYYNGRIPPSALVLQAVGSLGLTNGGDVVAVVSASGDTVAKATYIGDEKNKGRSLEKIIPNRNDAPQNYLPSLVSGGTPGFRNSRNPRDRDLRLSVRPQFSAPPLTPVAVSVAAVNRGLLPFGNGAVLKIFQDADLNGLGESNEELQTFTLASDVAPNDSAVRSYTFTPASRDTVRFVFTLTAAGDEDLTSNTALSQLVIGSPRNAIVVNEILYAPVQSSTDFVQDQPDFIEIYNRSDSTFNLAGWSVSTLPNENGLFDRYFFTADSGQSSTLLPKEYAVLTPEDTASRENSRLIKSFTYLSNSSAKIFFVRGRSTLALANENGLVQLSDNTGAVVDSVRYFDDWESPFLSSASGKSLEKINPEFPSNDRRSWTSSPDRQFGGSPARQNAAFAQSLSAPATSVAVQPNPFSPDGDGRDDNAVIAFNLTGADNRIRVKIYDVRGRLVRTLENSSRAAQSGQIVWNGLDEGGQVARMGIYVVFLEAIDSISARTESFRTTVVLARPLR